MYAKYGTNEGSFYIGRIEYIINAVRVHWEGNTFTDYTITRFNAAVENLSSSTIYDNDDTNNDANNDANTNTNTNTNNAHPLSSLQSSFQSSSSSSSSSQLSLTKIELCISES